MARVLLATLDKTTLSITAALAGHELLHANDINHAQKIIDSEVIDLCVIGVHFDESRSLELVKMLRDAGHRHCPILMIRTLPSDMATFIRTTVHSMKPLLDIDDYLELEGDPLAEMKIREAVERLLLTAAID